MKDGIQGEKQCLSCGTISMELPVYFDNKAIIQIVALQNHVFKSQHIIIMTAFTKFHDLPIMRDSVKRSALHTSLQTDYIVLTSHVPPTEEATSLFPIFGSQ